MSLYICPKCHETFDEPFYESDDTGGWSSCPMCGSPDFEEAWHCACCGEDFAFGDLIGGVLCKECFHNEPGSLDRLDFCRNDQPEAFAEFLVEKYADRWKERRLSVARKVRTDG